MVASGLALAAAMLSTVLVLKVWSYERLCEGRIAQILESLKDDPQFSVERTRLLQDLIDRSNKRDSGGAASSPLSSP